MSNTFLKSDIDKTQMYSLKEKLFNNSGFSVPFVIGEGTDTCTVSPELGQLDLKVDNFCEKPSYIPELDEEERRNSMYFPFGDKLEGYNLNDLFNKDYIKARGTWTTEDDNEYYEIRNRRYRKKTFLPEEAVTNLSNYYLKNNSIPLDKNSNISTFSYSNSYYGPNSEYGEKINFDFEGVMPGTSASEDNLLIDCFTENEFSENSVYDIPTKVIERNNDEFENYVFSKTLSEAYTGNITFSFFSRLDDTVYNGTNENVNVRKSPKGQCHAQIKVNGQVADIITFVFDSNWKRHLSSPISVENMTDIEITIKDINITGTDKLKVCGFMLNKGDYAVNYDRRYHFKSPSTPVTISYPILIKLLDNSDNHYLSSDSQWTMIYKRLISSKNVNQEKIDTLGNNYIQIGYKNNHPFFKVGDSEYTETEEEHNTVFWEHVVLSYRNGKVLCRIYKNDKVILDKEMTLSDTSLLNDTVSINSENYIFNLLLGSYMDNGLVKINNYCKYKDLMVFSKGLSDTEINDVSRSLISVDTDGLSYYERTEEVSGVNTTTYELRAGLISLRSSSFIETNNIGV